MRLQLHQHHEVYMRGPVSVPHTCFERRFRLAGMNDDLSSEDEAVPARRRQVSTTSGMCLLVSRRIAMLLASWLFKRSSPAVTTSARGQEGGVAAC